jgi:hypothetical protein
MTGRLTSWYSARMTVHSVNPLRPSYKHKYTLIMDELRANVLINVHTYEIYTSIE